MDIQDMITVFATVAIMLFVVTQVLGNPSLGDCKNLPKADGTGIGSAPASSGETGWKGQCASLVKATSSAFGLLEIVLIVIVAAIIIGIMRFWR